MAPSLSRLRARTVAVAALVALTAAGLAYAQRVSQNLPFAGGYRGSIGPDPPLDRTAPQRAEVAARVYRAILRGEARRYLAAPRAGEPAPDAADVFDARLAERLGEWSVRWMEAARNAGGRAARFDAVRAHLDRMRALESGRSLHDAIGEADRSVDVARLGEFVEVSRFFRLDAESRLQDLRSR